MDTRGIREQSAARDRNQGGKEETGVESRVFHWVGLIGLCKSRRREAEKIAAGLLPFRRLVPPREVKRDEAGRRLYERVCGHR